MKPLTENQANTLNFIRSHIKKTGRSPSIVEIAAKFDCFPNASRDVVKALTKKGAITVIEGQHRSIVPVSGYRAKVKEL